MTIGWYPGHMSKARRLLEGQLAKVDIIVEVCDARLPASSRNPQLDSLVAHKNHILLLNKADLANPGATAQWLVARELGPGWALVGHNPGLPDAAAALLGEEGGLRLKKGAAIGFHLVESNWKLEWVWAPGKSPKRSLSRRAEPGGGMRFSSLVSPP